MTRNARGAVLAALLLAQGLAGCQGHVQLTAPPIDAPESERLRAYELLRPTSRRVIRTNTLGPRHGAPTQTHYDTLYVRLANGQHVRYPEDLLPVVPADSEVAHLARASRWRRSVRVPMMVAGGVVGVGGVVAGIALAARTGQDTVERIEGAAIGLLVYCVGAALLGGGFNLNKTATDKADQAYAGYEPALRERLRLCGDYGNMVTCPEAYSAPPAPPRAALKPFRKAPRLPQPRVSR